MKKVLKIAGYIVVVLIVAVVGLLTYVKTALPNVGEPENLTIEYTAERVARGKYLANSVCVCMDCHSTRDFSKFSGPLVEGTLGKGGDRFDQTVGMPGVFFPKNITPHGISRYTDGELFRVITAGVTKEGRPMFPLMPYPYYGRMDKEDIYSIIAYVRSIPEIINDVPDSEADFPVNFILHTIPAKGVPESIPSRSDKIAYGKYLTNASGCRECHTKDKQGQIIPELEYSGGREFMFPDGSICRSANITPDKASGIGSWTSDIFVNRFKIYGDSSYVAETVAPGEFNTIMPWTMYAGMEKEDLEAIFAYLQTVTPMQNSVTKFTAGGK
ncbi:MAG TPA: c-type cytochrome [Cyclobacteriaceae bacterium]|nr:c-type cytochrome [Cyclobacteriaceae bacterium]